MITIIGMILGAWFMLWLLGTILDAVVEAISIPVLIGRKRKEKKQKEKDRVYAKEHDCEDWFMAKYGEPIDYDDYMKKRK